MVLKHLQGLNNLKIKHVLFLLSIIVMLGFTVRYVPFLHKLMLDDTYYQYSITNFIVENGHAPDRLSLAMYPKGKSLHNAPLLLPYTIAYTYKVIQLFGTSLTEYMIVFPAIFGALAAVPLYLLLKQLFDKRIAITSTFIYVLLPASIERTFAGFVEKESIAAITVFMWLYLFVKSRKKLDLEDKSTLLFPILSGMFMGVSFLAWRGVVYFGFLIAAAVLIQTLIKPDKALAYSTAIMSISGFTIMHLIQPAVFSIQKFFFYYRYAPITYVSILAVILVSSTYLDGLFKKRLNPVYLVGLFTAISILSIIVLNLQNRVFEMLNALITVFTGQNTPLAVESQTATSAGYTFIQNPFSLLVFFMPPGAYYFLKDSTENLTFDRLLVSLWFFTGAYASYLQIRLFFILAPIASALIAYGFFKILDSTTNQISFEGNNGKDDRVPEGQGSSAKLISGVLIVLLSLSIIGTVASEVRFANDLKKSQEGRIVNWENSMTFIREETPIDSLVIAWWDYGYIIQGLGERATIVDPGVEGGRRVAISKILTSTENDALKIIKKYNPENKPVYVIVSYEEFLLSRSINHMAQDNLYFYYESFPKSGNQERDERVIKEFIDELGVDSFALENLGTERGMWFTGLVPLPSGEYLLDLEMKNKLLPKLLPFNTGFGKGLKHFKLVYNDPDGYIFVYQAI